MNKNTKEYEEGYEQFENLMNRIMEHIHSSMEKIMPDLIIRLADSFSNTDNDELLKKRLRQMVKDGLHLWCIDKANNMLLKQQITNKHIEKEQLN